MKIYRIRNDYMIYGYFYCDDDYNNAYIDIVDGLDEYPAFLYMFADKGIYSINEYWTNRWMNERVIPYERQNINSILKDNGLEYYNEILMIIKQKGKSSMDDTYLEAIKDDYFVKERRKLLIRDFIKLDNNKLLVFFNDGNTKIFDYKKEIKEEPFLYPFGNEIIFNQVDRFNYLELYYHSADSPLSYNNLINYMNDNIITYKEVMHELSISKQSVYNLKNKEEIINLNNNLFLKNNIKKIK